MRPCLRVTEHHPCAVSAGMAAAPTAQSTTRPLIQATGDSDSDQGDSGSQAQYQSSVEVHQCPRTLVDETSSSTPDNDPRAAGLLTDTRIGLDRAGRRSGAGRPVLPASAQAEGAVVASVGAAVTSEDVEQGAVGGAPAQVGAGEKKKKQAKERKKAGRRETSTEAGASNIGFDDDHYAEKSTQDAQRRREQRDGDRRASRAPREGPRDRNEEVAPDHAAEQPVRVHAERKAHERKSKRNRRSDGDGEVNIVVPKSEPPRGGDEDEGGSNVQIV